MTDTLARKPRRYRSREAERALDQAQIQFRLSKDLHRRLHAEAKRRDVSVNYLIERALVDGLAKWEKQKLV